MSAKVSQVGADTISSRKSPLGPQPPRAAFSRRTGGSKLGPQPMELFFLPGPQSSQPDCELPQGRGQECSSLGFAKTHLRRLTRCVSGGEATQGRLDQEVRRGGSQGFRAFLLSGNPTQGLSGSSYSFCRPWCSWSLRSCLFPSSEAPSCYSSTAKKKQKTKNRVIS